MVKNRGECQATNVMNERMEKGKTSVLVKKKMLIRESGRMWPSNTTEDCGILDIERHKPRDMAISAADPFKVHMQSGLMLRYLSADTDTSFPLWLNAGVQKYCKSHQVLFPWQIELHFRGDARSIDCLQHLRSSTGANVY